jgi:hypothetical protein
MTTRIPALTLTGANKYQNADKTVTLTITNEVNNNESWTGIDGKVQTNIAKRTIVVDADLCTDQSRKYPAFKASIKISVPTAELDLPNGNEVIVPSFPVSSNSGEIRFSNADVKQTIAAMLDYVFTGQQPGIGSDSAI